MAEEKDLTQAKFVFDNICEMLDDDGWKYKKDEEKLSVAFGMKGEDLPMEVKIYVRPQINIVELYSHMPFKVKEDKRVDMAVAVSVINNTMVEGNFDFNIKTGTLLFRSTLCFDDSVILKDSYKFMLALSLGMVDEYNDKFLMLSNGIFTLEKFLECVGN